MAHLRRFVNVIWKDCINFVDGHPRTGWYIVVVLTLNVVLNVLDLVVG